MSKNKLYTLSYFRKRLNEAGYNSNILIKDYEETDSRYWTIKLFNNKNILCTCYKQTDITREDCIFEFWDGGNFYKNRYIICTESMQVVISHLNDISNKIEEDIELSKLSEIIPKD